MELLNVWQQYVDVIYMNEIETMYIDKAATSESIDAMLNQTAATRMEQRVSSEKLANLFGNSEEALQKEKDDNAKDVAEPYKTVEEGLTSDTTDEGSISELEAKVDS
jgi:hypothetical protein